MAPAKKGRDNEHHRFAIRRVSWKSYPTQEGCRQKQSEQEWTEGIDSSRPRTAHNNPVSRTGFGGGGGARYFCDLRDCV